MNTELPRPRALGVGASGITSIFNICF